MYYFYIKRYNISYNYAVQDKSFFFASAYQRLICNPPSVKLQYMLDKEGRER